MTHLIEKCKREHYLTKFKNLTSCKDFFATIDQLLGKDTNTSLPSGQEQELRGHFASFFFPAKINTIQEETNAQNSLLKMNILAAHFYMFLEK